MKVQDLYGINPPRKPGKQSVGGVKHRKVDKNEASKASSARKSDQVEISQEAQELQKSKNEVGVAKELLAKLPSARAHIIYEALAKIKAGLYSSDEIVEEAAAKLIKSGELNDLFDL